MKITLSSSDPHQSNFIMSPYLLLLFLVHVHVFKRYSKQHFHLLNYFGQNKLYLPPDPNFSSFYLVKMYFRIYAWRLKTSWFFQIFCIERCPYHSCSSRKIKKVFTYNKATLQMPFLAIENLQNINILNTVTVPHHNTIR